MNEIIIKGAKENNLKNINLVLPRNKLIVFTGVSGSGKSTLAFNTIFAEGQRRYIESLSSYARQFLGQSQKPDVESIEGLSPAISIDQKTTNHNPRSTVGTVTEIYDYLRLLFARVGKPFCPHCNKEISMQTLDQICDKVMTYPVESKIMVMAPVVRAQKGAQQKLFENLKKSGFVRVEVDNNMYTFDENITLDKNLKHDISVVVDRLVIKEDIQTRLSESIETALKLADGLVIIKIGEEKELFSTNFACPDCGFTIEEITPRLFSFNSPFGACPNCTGLGFTTDIDENIVLKNSNLSISKGALNTSGFLYEKGTMAYQLYNALSEKYGIDLNQPLNQMSREHLNILLYGTDEQIKIVMNSGKFSGSYNSKFEGIVNYLSRRYKETTSEIARLEIAKFMSEHTCKVCEGKRLNTSALAVKINKKDITYYCNLSVDDLIKEISELKFSKQDTIIAENIIKEINARLQFLVDVGLSYLTLARSSESLSGGESQRIRLATQIGSGLIGVLYILDEPSIGLHQRDNEKLLGTLKKLRDIGNTLIVVEHDEDTIRAADYIVDVGPRAGVHGGEIVAQGTIQDILDEPKSVTGEFLKNKNYIPIPTVRHELKNGYIKIKNAYKNNLKHIDVNIPKSVLTVITGVSGSGKSSLVNGILAPYLSTMLNGANPKPKYFDKIENIDNLDKAIVIDQSPIGRTPRSNPATYTGLFTPIRELYANLPASKERGYTAGRFSFNISGGRCEACQGAGIKEIEMYFLPDITVPCEVCKGKRYNRETLEVKFKGKTISDILNMTIEEVAPIFESLPQIKLKIDALLDVGLGYIKLGQAATELSGGEAQRVKLASELCKRSTGKTVYILDEPTTGLHAYDIKKLISILNKLVSTGNTVIVIEHNLDVIKCADYIIDLGPEGGDKGGNIVAQGTPEEIAENKNSFTGHFLKNILK